MFEDGTRVRSISTGRVIHYNKVGTIVASSGRRYKVLFDEDKGKCADDLTLAYWFFDIELEAATKSMAHKKGLFHLVRVPVSAYETCYDVFFKEVSSSEELVRSADKGELMGKYRTRDSARDRIDDLARPYGEFAIFE